MSLTSVLKKERDRKNLKNWFKHHFPTPDFPEVPALLVNSCTDAAYSAEIGTAFDYLFRFKLEYVNGSKCETRRWVAQDGLKRLNKRIDATKEQWIIVGGAKPKIVDKNELKASVLEGFAKAQQHHSDFGQTGIMGEGLIKSSVFLARLDSVFRTQAQEIPVDFESVPTEEVAELTALLEAVPWAVFKATQRCLLNPAFASAAPIGGADADLIIDNKLIDLKTSKHFKLERADLNQLIGYCLLAVLDGQGEGVDELGIYFARFGFLWTFPLTAFYDMPLYLKLAQQFSQLITDTELNLVDGDEMRKEQDLRQFNWDF